MATNNTIPIQPTEDKMATERTAVAPRLAWSMDLGLYKRHIRKYTDKYKYGRYWDRTAANSASGTLFLT